MVYSENNYKHTLIWATIDCSVYIGTVYLHYLFNTPAYANITSQ